MKYTTRPLTDRSWLNPAARRPTRFTATWSDTLDLLDIEVTMLGGHDVVLEVDVTEADLRLDGTIRARARAASPAVIVSFTTKRHGPLMYRCDRYEPAYYNQPDGWQQNVRAIALTLQALRAVDRYGATRSGEQYAGWRQIDARPAPTPHEALAVLQRLAGQPITDVQRLVTVARRRAHPDHGGTTDTWHEFQAAAAAVQGRNPQ